ncbi:MAG: integrase, partial [Chloroflexota bacterium]
MPQEGMLVQIDGSHHRWLGEDGPWLTLLLAVDDATGTVPYALFREQEDTEGYFRLMKGIIERRGIPLALYSDRYFVFCHSKPGNETGEASLVDR